MRHWLRRIAWALLPAMAAGMAQAQSDVPAGARACLGCHAVAAAAPTIEAAPVPLLAGQQEEYLVKQLRNFRDGERALAPALRPGHALDAASLRALAAWFAAQPPPERAGAGSTQGRRLYLEGDARRNVPACAGCHGEQPKDVAGAATPVLHGQAAAYLAQQLRLWRGGQRDNSVDQQMNLVAERLADEDIAALANYLATAH